MFFKKPQFALQSAASKFGAAGVSFGTHASTAANLAFGFGVVAPVVLSDENRDPLQTALITTPLAAAGYLAAPRLMEATRRARSTMPEFWRQSRLAFSGNINAVDLRTAIETGRLHPQSLGIGESVNALQNALDLDYYRRTNFAQKKPNPGLAAKKIERYFRDLEVAEALVTLKQKYQGGAIPSNEPLLEVARRGLKPRILDDPKRLERWTRRYERMLPADYGPFGAAIDYSLNRARTLNQRTGYTDRSTSKLADLRQLYESNKGNEDFLSHLSRKVKKLRRMPVLPAVAPGLSISQRIIPGILEGSTKKQELAYLQHLVETQLGRKDLAQALGGLQDHINGFDGFDALFEETRTGKQITRKLAGVSFRKGDESLLVGFADLQNGTVRYGRKALKNLGVNRRFINPEKGILSSDIWALNQLNSGRSMSEIRRELHKNTRWFARAWGSFIERGREKFDHGTLAGRMISHQVRPDPFYEFAIDANTRARFHDLPLDARGKILKEMVAESGLVPGASAQAFVKHGVMLTSEAAGWEVSGVVPTSDQMLAHRALTKEVEIAGATVAGHRPNVVARDLIELAEGGSYSGFKLTAGHTMPYHHSVAEGFAALSRGVPQAELERAFNGALFAGTEKEQWYRQTWEQMISVLRDKENLSQEQAEVTLKKMSGLIASNQSYVKGVELLAASGESEPIIRASAFEGQYTRTLETIMVDKFRGTAPDKLIADGTLFGDEIPLGEHQGVLRTASGKRNRLLSYKEIDKGVWALQVENLRPLVSNDSKIDFGVKTYEMSATDDAYAAAAEYANTLNETMGRPERINPLRVQAIVSHQYGSVPAKDPVKDLLNRSSELLQEIHSKSSDETLKGMAEEYARSLQPFGYEVEPSGYMSYDHKVVAAAKKREALAQVTRLSQEMIDRVGKYAATNPGAVQNSSLFADYLGTVGADGKPLWSLDEFMRRQHNVHEAFVWAHSDYQAAKRVAVTVQMRSMAQRLGLTEVVRELAQTTHHIKGDPSMTLEMLEYLEKGDFTSRPAGDIRKLGPPIKLSTGRAESIFDPTLPENFGNRYLDLGRTGTVVDHTGKEIKVNYFPMLGSKAVGGAPHEYPGGFTPTEMEKRINRLMKVREAPDEEFNKVLQEAWDKQAEIFKGKKGLFRTRQLARTGTVGIMRTVGTAPEDIFDSYLSHDKFEEIRRMNPEYARQIQEGEAYALGLRYPESNVQIRRVRYDRQVADVLGQGMIGESMSSRASIRADADGDQRYLVYLQEKESLARARREVQRGSDQWIRETVMGQWRNMEEHRNVPSSVIEEMLQNPDYMRKIEKDRLDLARALETIPQRLEGTNVGKFSNFVDRVRYGLANSSAYRSADSTTKALVEPAIFALKQVPIKLQRGAMNIASGDRMLAALRQSWETGDDFSANRFIETLKDAHLGSGEEALLDDTVHQTFGLGRYYDVDRKEMIAAAELLGKNRRVNVGYSLLAENKTLTDLLSTVVKEDHTASDTFSRWIQTQFDPQARAEIGATGSMLEDLARIGETAPETLGAIGRKPVRNAASETARTLGALNEATRSAAKGLKKALGPATPILAAGIGVAALAGMMTSAAPRLRATPPAPPSANRHRPEQDIGGTDQVPGEPVAGSRSTAPPRDYVERPQVKTAVVAPMRRSHNIEVDVTGPERSQFRETERSLEGMISQGNTYITKNYVGGWRQNGSRLRNRERYQEEMDRYR